MVAPALVFLGFAFFAPLASFAWRAVDNAENWSALPRTRQALGLWRCSGDAPAGLADAFLADVQALSSADVAALGRRLNYSEAGLRSLVVGLRAKPLDPGRAAKPQMVERDPRWGQSRVWEVVCANGTYLTDAYLLRALDLRRTGGTIEPVAGDEGAFRVVFTRTFWIAAVVTALCAVLGFPVAYAMSRPGGGVWPRVLLACVLFPFWTSILVRTTSWVLLLQQNGILNRFLIEQGLIEAPLALIYNRVGVYIAMTHVLLPMFILPVYSVMLKTDKALLRAAASLGAPPLAVLRHAYLPQILPGMVAGAVLVFVTALGFYITPVLVGGGGDQMVSYFVAFFTNVSVNWGQAAALGMLLLAATLAVLAACRAALGRSAIAARP